MTSEQKVLWILEQWGKTSGRKLREELNKRCPWYWQFSAPAFYMLMARLEDEGKVKCLTEYRDSNIYPAVREYELRK